MPIKYSSKRSSNAHKHGEGFATTESRAARQFNSFALGPLRLSALIVPLLIGIILVYSSWLFATTFWTSSFQVAMKWQSSFLPAVLLAGGNGVLSKPLITDLGKLNWRLSNPSLNISVPGRVPSSVGMRIYAEDNADSGKVHLDLWDANVIGDPYYGLNDFNLRWIVWQNWTYSTKLALEKTSASTYLLFNGLDTFADVDLCGKRVASTNNQFRQYHFDITNILKECDGPADLQIHFGSTAKIAETIAQLPGQETWPPNIEGIFEFEHRQFVRKEQNDFGWDWGPAFIPTGVWQPAYLVQLEPVQLHVRNTLIDIYRKGQLPLLIPDQTQPWLVNASIDVIGKVPQKATVSFELLSLDGKQMAQGSMINVTRTASTITGGASVPASLVELWWPVGMGKQALYNLRLTIASEKGDPITSVTKRVGFRTIVLNQEPIRPDQLAKGIAPGSNWHFEINGREFYAKGSNFIPPDCFWTRVNETRIQRLFKSVVDGNQNMLRVWSSGAYSPDFMYDLADEMGILLWSEFEFGDALYPVDKEFIDNVRAEVEYQVRRINHHPSLALWAGGNELENLELTQIRDSSPALLPKYMAEYEQLFLHTIGVTVFENSKSISYTPSSTSNGWAQLDFSKAQPITQRYYNVSRDEVHGDTDYYNYHSAMAFDYESYPKGRFSNEFGFHSMPSIQTWRQAVDTSDLRMDSPVVVLRNHHPPPGGLNSSNIEVAQSGMNEMIEAAKNWYPTPNKRDPIANFTSWCLITQIFQADFYASQIQFYRRGSGLRERQLGSLYWQLEDIWQAPTWAGIEYDGRWKFLHYVAKDRYKNVIISPFQILETSTLEVQVTSDLWSPVSGTAKFQWFDWSGKKLNLSTPASLPVQVGAINSTKILELNLTQTLGGRRPADLVLQMETSVLGSLPNSGNKTQEFKHKAWFHPVPLTNASLVDPGLVLTHNSQKKKFRVEATKGVAAWVWLDYPAGVLVHFEDNGFWIAPGEPLNVGYYVDPETDTTKGKWVSGVTISSLWDMTVP